MKKNVSQLISLMDRLQNLRMNRPPMDKIEPDLTMPQMILLRHVGLNPGCRAHEIADGLEITPPSVSVAIRKLEDSGWLESRVDDEDRRAKRIYPTAKTEFIQNQFEKFRIKNSTSFLDGLDQTEQFQLLGLLEKAILMAESKE